MMTDQVCPAKIAYALSFAILFGYRALGGVDGPAYYTPMVLFAVGVMVVKIAMTKHSVAELLCIGLLFFCAGITYILTGEKGLLIDYALMLGMKGITERRLAGFAIWILGPAMFFVTMPYALGILEDLGTGVPRHPWSAIRYCLGYPHTNTLLTTFIILMMLVMYITGSENRKHILIRSLIMLLGSFYLWLWCDSRTGALITVLYLAMNLYFSCFARFGLFDRFMIYGLYPVINLVSIGGTLFYGRIGNVDQNSIFYSLFDRFRLTHLYAETYPISLFGVRIVIPETELFAIDVSQIHLFLNLGIIAFVTVSVLYYILLVDCVRGERRSELPIILCLMIMGISDPLLYNLSCKNLTFLFMGTALYRLFEKRRAISAKEGVRKWLSREILILPVGRRELPRLSVFLKRMGEWTRSVFIEGRKHGQLRLSVALGLMTALVYGLCMVSRIQPIKGNLLAGQYVFGLHVLSWGLYSFMIYYVLTCILFSVKGDKQQ